jgi:Nif-specific ferredoxin III
VAFITGLTRDKQSWTPEFISSIDRESCIGCGRCIKGCAHDVLSFTELSGPDSCKTFMTVKNPGNCIGCGACTRTCPKKCITLEPMPA